MAGKIFFDTNVLIYSIAKNDPRSKFAEELLGKGGIVSVQVLNEFVSVARRKIQMEWDEIQQVLEVFQELCPRPVPLTVETHAQALRICKRHSYGIYDALIIAAALESGCSILYSEDLRDGQRFEGKLTIRNPFDKAPK